VSAAPVYGLVLAGGSSKRMQRDKAALRYQGITQLDRAFDLVTRHSERSFVSVRASQSQEPARASKPQIIDSLDGEGPLVGIRSAMAAYPEAAWLVLACDLPFLSDVMLERLLAQRDSAGFATAYRSSHDRLPEPLCALWEPRAAVALATHQLEGFNCPRKFLIRRGARLLEAVEPAALDNINTPNEYSDAQARLAQARTCS
jgi:molybdopterin-guanine dinucleotide biosynthesis protein A